MGHSGPTIDTFARSDRRRRWSWLLAVLLLLSSAAAAQTAASGVEAALQKALAHVQAGELDPIIPLLEPYRADPQAPPTLFALLGAVYLEKQLPADALEVLTPLAEQPEADPAVLYNAARAALAVGQAEVGEAYLERSVANKPGTPASRDLGMLRGSQGRMEEALELLGPWLDAHPEDRAARLAALQSALVLKRTGEAQALLGGLDPEEPMARLLRGRLQVIEGDAPGAITTLQPLLTPPGNPLVASALPALADAYLAAGQHGEVITLLSDKVEGRPGLALRLARAQEAGGDLAAARATLKPFAERLLTFDDYGADHSLATALAFTYGRLLGTGEHAAEALPYLRLVTRLQPDDGAAWAQLGEVLAALGQEEEAAQARARARGGSGTGS